MNFILIDKKTKTEKFCDLVEDFGVIDGRDRIIIRRWYR